MTLLESYLDFIQDESYSSTTFRRNRTQKTRAAAGSIAASLAKKRNDPQYRRMMYFKQQYIKQKKQLQKRYKSKAMALARQKASKFKKH
jgi:hypothetical protein